ncbi:lipid asymmetry maintenance protein MlaB [Modestobacter sp. I12A-02662]|uniref:STAS domain-containing protein n=1 Tax=Modestobacter sp. I12A-02662 TaxID=1730496 RepID=UPI0034DF337C
MDCAAAHVPAGGSPAGAVQLGEDATGPLLRFTGRVDKEVVRSFRRGVAPASWPARIDLTAVTALDPAGLELLLHLARKQARTGATLQVIGLAGSLRPALERAGLGRLLPRPGA